MHDCSPEFDPRFRPWYAVASGPKDVIIVIDVSGSMATAGRMTAAITAATAAIATFTEYDYAAVVKFNSSASSAQTQMIQMTTANKLILTN